jgi:hypothetical protein
LNIEFKQSFYKRCGSVNKSKNCIELSTAKYLLTKSFMKGDCQKSIMEKKYIC